MHKHSTTRPPARRRAIPTSRLFGSEHHLARLLLPGAIIATDPAPFCQTGGPTVPNDPDLSTPYRFSSLANKGAMVRLAIIGAAVLGVVGCFAFVAGWLSPHRLTQDRMIDTFEEVIGVYPGFRRNPAKGVCIAGYFESNGQGAAYRRPPSSSPDGCRSSAVSHSPAVSPICRIGRRRSRRQCAAWRSPSARRMARNGGRS